TSFRGSASASSSRATASPAGTGKAESPPGLSWLLRERSWPWCSDAHDREQVPLDGPARGVERRVRTEVLEARALAGRCEIVAEPGARVGRHLREPVVG